MVAGHEGSERPTGLIRRIERKIGTDYLQYQVAVDGGDFNTSWVDEVRNGLLDDNAEQLTVTTGLQYGRVAVILETWSTPPALELDEWDDVVEAGVRTVRGEIRLGELMSGPPRGMLNLAHAGPGAYRLRVSVRGRDLASAGKGKELHRLQCWPAAPGHDPATVVYKLTDQVGRQMRGEPAPPPDLQPWELAGGHAVKDFVAAITSAPLDEPTTTIEISETFPATRARIFRRLSALPVGNGGSGAVEVGHQFVRYFFTKPDYSWDMRLSAYWRTSSPPTHATWAVQWHQYDHLDSLSRIAEGHRLAGAGSLALSLAWDRPMTTATFTQTGVPISCAPSLTGTWQYNLRKYKEEIEGRPYTWEPWTLLP
jgi:hypothetical protein